MDAWSLRLEAALWERFGMKMGCLLPDAELLCFKTQYRDRAVAGGIEVKWLVRMWRARTCTPCMYPHVRPLVCMARTRLTSSHVVSRRLTSSQVVFSMVFVWAYVGFHTGSFALGSFALLLPENGGGGSSGKAPFAPPASRGRLALPQPLFPEKPLPPGACISHSVLGSRAVSNAGVL